jgi:hypothetical protein
MPKQQPDPTLRRLDELIAATENLFILQALQAGMTTEHIRRILKIDQLRVIAVSRHLKAARKGR